MTSSSVRRAAFSFGSAALVCLAIAAVVASPLRAASDLTKVRLPSLACYEARFSAFRSPVVRIGDQFGKLSTTVGDAVTLCSSSTVDGREKIDPYAHLACHAITDRRHNLLRVRALSPFGTLKATLVRLQTLCTPASITTGGTLGAPPAGLDNFACYSVRPVTASPTTVTVADWVGESRDKLGSISSICAPASVDGSEILQGRLLVCYGLTSGATARPVIVRSRLALLKASPGVRKQLCVPSTRL